MDKIIIKGLKFFAYHGVNPEEKEQGQNFIFDIILHVNINKACHSDNVEDTVSYAKVVKTVRPCFLCRKIRFARKMRSGGCGCDFGRISGGVYCRNNA